MSTLKLYCQNITDMWILASFRSTIWTHQNHPYKFDIWVRLGSHLMCLGFGRRGIWKIASVENSALYRSWGSLACNFCAFWGLNQNEAFVVSYTLLLFYNRLLFECFRMTLIFIESEVVTFVKSILKCWGNNVQGMVTADTNEWGASTTNAFFEHLKIDYWLALQFMSTWLTINSFSKRCVQYVHITRTHAIAGLQCNQTIW